MRKLLVVFGLTIISAGLSAQTGGVLKGSVIDSQTGEPLAGVTVTLGDSGEETITDFEGSFEFKGVEPGTTPVSISYISYRESGLSRIKIREDKTTELRIKLHQDRLEVETQRFVASVLPAATRS